MFGQKRLSREGGVEIVVKELCTRMAQNGCDVTCYNRAGHHVSGAEYDDAGKTEYEGIRQKSVPTIERRGARDIIRGCHNRDKGTAENERLRNPKFMFSYPKNERLIFLCGRNAAQEEISTMRVGWQPADRWASLSALCVGWNKNWQVETSGWCVNRWKIPFQRYGLKRSGGVKTMRNYKIAVAGTGARDIIGSTKKTYDN